MKKVTLEHPKLIDSPQIFDLVQNNRDEFALWFPWISQTKSIDDETKFLIEAEKNPKQEVYCIKYENQIVGLFDFHEIDKQTKMAEIGYWLDKNARGFGIMTKIVNELNRLIQDEIGISTIRAVINEKNTKSIDVVQRTGFTFLKKEGSDLVFSKEV